jgi:hypothetical protein
VVDQSGTSPESPGRENTFSNITFQKYRKIFFFKLKSTVAQLDLSKNALKLTNFQLVGQLDFLRARENNRSKFSIKLLSG